jgi:integrative and conjugative element protein (TIGR02256 family)
MQSAMMWHNHTDNRGEILIEPSVIELVRGYCQHQSNMPESGGILMGYRRGNHLHIVAATTPQPDDHRMRFHFSRRDLNHQKVAIRQWDISGNIMDYIGEWHTHPESDPMPSALDMSEWKKICCVQKTNMIFLIAGWSGNFWLGVGQGQSIVQASEVIIKESDL